MKQILNLTTNEPLVPQTDWLPMLITGLPGAGSSLFTMTLAAQFLSQAKKLLVISGYQMAVEELSAQIAQPTTPVMSRNELVPEKQLLYLEPQNADLLAKALTDLSDINERIVLVKNFELYCNRELLSQLLMIPQLILSGEKTGTESPKHWNSTVSFSGTDPAGRYVGEFVHGSSEKIIVG